MPLSIPIKVTTALPVIESKSFDTVKANFFYGADGQRRELGFIKAIGIQPFLVSKKINIMVELWCTQQNTAPDNKSRLSFGTESGSQSNFFDNLFVSAAIGALTGGLGSFLSTGISSFSGQAIGNILGNSAANYISANISKELNIIVDNPTPNQSQEIDGFLNKQLPSYGGINTTDPQIIQILKDGSLRRATFGFDNSKNKVYASEIDGFSFNMFDVDINTEPFDYNQIQIGNFQNFFNTEGYPILIYHYQITLLPEINNAN